MIVADLGTVVANASRLGASADLLLQALEHRAELAAVELEEAGQEVASALVWGLVGFTLALLAGVTLTIIVAAAFWDTPQRVVALVVLGVLELGLAAGAAWFATSRWKQWQLFKHSRDQLAKDSACLREILTPNKA